MWARALRCQGHAGPSHPPHVLPAPHSEPHGAHEETGSERAVLQRRVLWARAETETWVSGTWCPGPSLPCSKTWDGARMPSCPNGPTRRHIACPQGQGHSSPWGCFPVQKNTDWSTAPEEEAGAPAELPSECPQLALPRPVGSGPLNQQQAGRGARGWLRLHGSHSDGPQTCGSHSVPQFPHL